MLIRMSGPTGNMEKIRSEDVEHYLGLGYKRVVEPKTVELMSPAGRVTVAAKDVDERLQREGWSCLEDDAPEPDPDDDAEIRKDFEQSLESEKVEEPEPEKVEELEPEKTEELEPEKAEEPESVDDAEACDSVEEPEPDEAAEAQMEG